MREETFVFDFGTSVEHRINQLIRAGWRVDPSSIRLDCSEVVGWICVLLYREKGD